MKFHLVQRVSYSWLLSVILPGLGHILWGEYLFGMFVFLIMLLAIGMGYVGVWTGASSLYYWGLIVLPSLFFIFSLVDLRRAIVKRRGRHNPSTGRACFLLALSLAIQLLVPGSPARFMIDNRPTIFQAEQNDLSPLINRGDLLKANPMAYYVRLFFYDRPVYHSLPNRFDLVRFEALDQRLISGLVIGLPEEQVEVVDGRLIIDGGQPLVDRSPISLSGDSPLTSSEPYSILVAEFYMGRIKMVHQVSLLELVGKISPLL